MNELKIDYRTLWEWNHMVTKVHFGNVHFIYGFNSQIADFLAQIYVKLAKRQSMTFVCSHH